MSATPDFTVEATSGSRVRVSWTDAEARYHFIARAEGDKITEILPSTSRRVPTIFRNALQYEGRGTGAGVSYLNAEAEAHAPMIAAIKRKVEVEALVTAAALRAEQERRQREAAAIASKAAVIRREIGGAATIADGVTDAALANLYDRIQNSAW